MMPWGHFLIAVIPYISYSLIRHRKMPNGPILLVLLFGTQFPDLVDKPLAWQFDVLINGRIFMHSLVFAVPLSVAILLLAWIYDRRTIGGTFVFGYLLHIPGDFYTAFIRSGLHIPNNMLWPLFSPSPISKPEFVTQPGLLTFTGWDIVAVGIGTVLIGYTFITTINSARKYSTSLRII
ncbi:metal-dependent hydrolase [Haloarcula sp. 1CSR25-25]|jgi:membrane-bound metal-dependent hydrolase YbcI (DUF457 family)|nr:metal-dependent hydrolase [Haloarcula sp. 1CSR25-25]